MRVKPEPRMESCEKNWEWCEKNSKKKDKCLATSVPSKPWKCSCWNAIPCTSLVLEIGVSLLLIIQ